MDPRDDLAGQITRLPKEGNTTMTHPRQNPELPRRRGRPKLDNPNPIDVHVGSRVRQRRLFVGWSQQKLAKALGLSFQQLQKYEGGTNRIGASRLFRMGQALGVSVNYFFEALPDELAAPAPEVGAKGVRARGEPGQAAGRTPPESESGARMRFGGAGESREALELVAAYDRIDALLRRRILALVREIAGNDGDG